MSSKFTPQAGDEVFGLQGEAATYLAVAEGGHAVQLIYDQEGEPYAGEVALWQRVFREPPVQQLHDEIARLEKRRDEVRTELYAAEDARRNIDRDSKERLERIKQHKGLEQLDLFLAGKITHLVLCGGWSDMKIVEAKDELTEHDRYSRHNKLKLLSLFGDSNGDLAWGLSRYSDGSDGSPARVMPAVSHEHALELVRAELDARLKELRKQGVSERIGETERFFNDAQRFGVDVPDDVAAAVRAHRWRASAGELATAQKRLEEAQARVNELRAAAEARQ